MHNYQNYSLRTILETLCCYVQSVKYISLAIRHRSFVSATIHLAPRDYYRDTTGRQAGAITAITVPRKIRERAPCSRRSLYLRAPRRLRHLTSSAAAIHEVYRPAHGGGAQRYPMMTTPAGGVKAVRCAAAFLTCRWRDTRASRRVGGASWSMRTRRTEDAPDLGERIFVSCIL